jgi:type IV pilus assembly protein PilQ
MVSDIPKNSRRSGTGAGHRPSGRQIVRRVSSLLPKLAVRYAKFGLNGATGKDGDRSSSGFMAPDSSSQTRSRANACVRFRFRSLGEREPAGPTAGPLALSILNALPADVELSAMQEEGRGEASNPRV